MTVATGQRRSGGKGTVRRLASDRAVDARVRQEIESLKDGSGIEFRIEPRCRVCQEEASRVMVNKMLANAVGYREISDMVDLVVNPHRRKNSQISYNSIRYHAKKHFNIEEPAKAFYRKLLENRQVEAQLIQGGVSRLITALGFLDVVAQKGYETLSKEDTVVPVELGMDAVLKIEALTRKGNSEQEAAELRAQIAIIQSAVKEVVPQELWGDIVRRVEEAEGKPEPLDVEVVDDYDDEDDDDEGYSPPVEPDIDDELGT